jgi:hypothetical protein
VGIDLGLRLEQLAQISLAVAVDVVVDGAVNDRAAIALRRYPVKHGDRSLWQDDVDTLIHSVAALNDLTSIIVHTLRVDVNRSSRLAIQGARQAARALADKLS